MFPPILVVDVETTSANPAWGGLVEIGAQWLTGPRAREEFELKCTPREGVEIEPKALEVNGCDWLNSNDEAQEWEAIDAFLDWVGPDLVLLAGMNPQFDRWFLWNAFSSRQRSQGESLRFPPPLFPFPHRTLDLHTLAVQVMMEEGKEVPAKGLYTDEILELVGLPPEPKPHRAIAGARAEAEAFRRLLGL